MTELLNDPAALLRWYVDAGVDECIGEAPVDRFKPVPPAPVAAPRPVANVTAPAAAAPAVSFGAHPADAATSVAELKAMVEAFDGCGLKQFASNTVFADGNPSARVMLSVKRRAPTKTARVSRSSVCRASCSTA
jgi:hypothetical protein